MAYNYTIEEVEREDYPNKPVFYIRRFFTIFNYPVDCGLVTERYDDGEYSGKDTVSFWSLKDATEYVKKGFKRIEKKDKIVIHKLIN